MSLNPFVHVHPIYTLLIPSVLFWTGGGFFAAAWTPVNPSRMRRPQVHGLLVSLGGPAANLVLAVGSFLVLAVAILVMGGIDRATPGNRLQILDLVYLGVQLNLFMAIFNLLPFPPLDGSEIVAFFLPPRMRAGWMDLRRHAWIVLLILMMSGALDRVLHPPLRVAGRVVDDGIALVNGLARHGR